MADNAWNGFHINVLLRNWRMSICVASLKCVHCKRPIVGVTQEFWWFVMDTV